MRGWFIFGMVMGIWVLAGVFLAALLSMVWDHDEADADACGEIPEWVNEGNDDARAWVRRNTQ